MNKVMQTKFGPEKGNCFQACVATLLDLDIDEIPDTKEHFFDEQIEEINEWLREKFNFVLWSLEINGECWLFEQEYGVLHIMIGYSALGKEEMHAVTAIDGQLFHDPNPNSHGLEEVKYHVFLVRV